MPIRTLISSPVIQADSILDEVARHVVYLGYRVERLDGAIGIAQSGRFSWLLRDFRDGILFRKAFRSTELGRAQPAAILALSNSINTGASFIRTYVDKESHLAVESWYPNLYERASFGRFLHAVDVDLQDQLARCSAEVDRLLL